jgi:hypothetical protein
LKCRRSAQLVKPIASDPFEGEHGGMLIGLFLAMAAAYGPGCTRGSEFEPSLCPTHLPPIVSITIKETGAGTPDKRDVGQPPCRQFRPSRAQIIRYLSKARQTSGQSADATLDWSPCYASGTVRYKDGKTGRWIIQQLGVAYLYIPGREDMLIYCRECSQPPFGF